MLAGVEIVQNFPLRQFLPKRDQEWVVVELDRDGAVEPLDALQDHRRR
jgi:hypothetical protein